MEKITPPVALNQTSSSMSHMGRGTGVDAILLPEKKSPGSVRQIPHITNPSFHWTGRLSKSGARLSHSARRCRVAASHGPEQVGLQIAGQIIIIH